MTLQELYESQVDAGADPRETALYVDALLDAPPESFSILSSDRGCATSQKWRSRIWVHGRSIELGLFETESEAAVAYNKAALLHFSEFAAPQ